MGSARHEFVCLAASRGSGHSSDEVAVLQSLDAPGGAAVKSAEEIMNMLEAFDLTGSLRDAGRAGWGLAPHRGPVREGAWRPVR